MEDLKIGDIVSIDTDNDDWGRVVGKAEVLDIDEYGFITIHSYDIRATVIIHRDEIMSKLED